MYLGVERPTFLIDGAGETARVLRKIQPREHNYLVLKARPALGN